MDIVLMGDWKEKYIFNQNCKLYLPMHEWYDAAHTKVEDISPQRNHCTVYGAVRQGEGFYFDGSDDYIADKDGRKILREGTKGVWHSVKLHDTLIHPYGSVQGTGTKLYFSNGNETPPKLTGILVFYPEFCPNITHLNCERNSISTLDVSNLTSLTVLSCDNNSISTLDVSNLTSLTHLYCYNNSISTLDVHLLSSLTNLRCQNNSMNQSTVDTILCDMDAHGTSNGYIDISGNNAAPSATGVNCKNNLESRGWTVKTS